MRKSPALLILLGLFCVAGVARADLQDVDITATRERLDQDTSRPGGNLTVTTKDIVYNITVKSKRFKPITNLQVKYMIFYKDPKAGSTANAVDLSHIGSESFPLLDANRSVTFPTKPLQLKTEALDAGWYYTNGGNANAQDKVTGVWVRVFGDDGKMLGEYSNPTTVAKRQTWKDQPSPNPAGQ